jgi:uncharacterized membrane protein
VPSASNRQLRSATLLGLACGLRTFSAPAVLALHKRPLNAPHRTVLLAALGELVADKLPSMPSRLERRGLTGRLLSSSATGGSLAGPTGAATAALAALVSAVAGNRARTAIASPLAPFAEDGLAIALATIGAAGRGD